MNNKEILGMDTEEIIIKINEMRTELVKLNAQVATGTNPKNPGQIKQIRKSVAQMKTVMQQRRAKAKQKEKEMEKKQE